MFLVDLGLETRSKSRHHGSFSEHLRSETHIIPMSSNEPTQSIRILALFFSVVGPARIQLPVFEEGHIELELDWNGIDLPAKQVLVFQLESPWISIDRRRIEVMGYELSD